MDTLIVVLIVAAAGGFLGNRALGKWRAARASAGCASDCGCSAADKAPASWDTTGVV